MTRRPPYSAWRQARAVARKELKQVVRDQQTLGILLFVPLFFLLVFGYALNFDIKHVQLGVHDRDQSAESRQLVSAFTNSEYFDLAASVTSFAQIETLMDRGDLRVALVIPEDFGRDVRTVRRPMAQVLINGDNANTATTVMGYVLAITRDVSADFAARQLRAPTVGLDRVTVEPSSQLLRAEPRVWFNPELRTTSFLVPGLVAYIAMIVAVISTAISLVREKERGTIEQVRMAPIGTLTFVVGKTLPYFGLSLVSVMLIFVAAMTLFDLPMNGSWLLLVLSTSLFLTGALGFGLVISTIADSQQAAFQLAMIVSLLPTIVLSGFIFPIASMPVAIQAVTYLVPARYYLVALRGIVLKGVGLDAFGGQLVALSLFTVVTLGFAAIRLARERA